jgi:hypothetical protein
VVVAPLGQPRGLITSDHTGYLPSLVVLMNWT